MPYPPSLPPNNRTDTTPSFGNHPSDHNALVNALAAIIAELGNNPSGVATDVTALIGQLAPVGAIQMFAMPAAPTGWLLCDGAGQPTATYPALFGVIGYTYGGSGGTFNMPDMRGKFPVGRNVADPLFDNVNDFGGSKDSVSIDHGHVLNDPTHTHSVDPDSLTVPGVYGTRGAPAAWAVGAVGVIYGPSGGNSGSPGDWWDRPITVDLPGKGTTPAGTGITLNRDGVAGTNLNLPPFRTLSFIIKAS